MVEKLRRWGFDETVQARIVAYLVEHRYVDDARYAEAFVREKMRFNRWGPRKIEQALWAKHVDAQVFQPVLDSVERDEWVTMLRELLTTQRRRVKAASDYELSQKLWRFAVSRGFTGDVVAEALEMKNEE